MSTSTPNTLERFAVVLFKPAASGNIGAAARALKNMGMADLRLVAPRSFNRRAAATMAVHARNVLESARIFPTLAEALEDRTLTIGTTCRPGAYRSAARPLREAAASLASNRSRERVAIIFGPEDTGLTNRELKACQQLITIPASAGYPSLNLAQAVMLVAYELMMAAGGAAQPGGAARSARAAPPRAPASAVDAMFERMAQALVAIGFLPAANPDHIMFTLRAILGRSGLSPRELDILSGIARQIRWFAEGGHATIAAKRQAGRKIR